MSNQFKDLCQLCVDIEKMEFKPVVLDFMDRGRLVRGSEAHWNEKLR